MDWLSLSSVTLSSLWLIWDFTARLLQSIRWECISSTHALDREGEEIRVWWGRLPGCRPRKGTSRFQSETQGQRVFLVSNVIEKYEDWLEVEGVATGESYTVRRKDGLEVRVTWTYRETKWLLKKTQNQGDCRGSKEQEERWGVE